MQIRKSSLGRVTGGNARAVVEIGGIFNAFGMLLHGYAFILIFRNSLSISKEVQSKIIWIIVFGVILQIIGTFFNSTTSAGL